MDANLYHDLIMGQSVTGILHLINKTPIDWFSKKQSTVETVTFSSEFIAAHICTEQAIDLCTTLCYLGVLVKSKGYMFSDNHTVIDASMILHNKLHKRHMALSLHHVCEAIAAGIIRFHYLPSQENPTDILSKHWGHQQV